VAREERKCALKEGRGKSSAILSLSLSLSLSLVLVSASLKSCEAFVEPAGKIRSGWMFLLKFHFHACITYFYAHVYAVSLIENVARVSREISVRAPRLFAERLPRMNVKSLSVIAVSRMQRLSMHIYNRRCINAYQESLMIYQRCAEARG